MKHSDDNIKNTFKTSSKRACNIGTERKLIIITIMNIFTNRLIFNGCEFFNYRIHNIDIKLYSKQY